MVEWFEGVGGKVMLREVGGDERVSQQGQLPAVLYV